MSQWPQTDIFLPPRPIPGFELEESRIVRPDIHKLCPYYHLVPKNLNDNIAFRKEMIRYGTESKFGAQELWKMCARDILFFCNFACMTYDPRKSGRGESPVIPWITYPYQDHALCAINEAIPSIDLNIRKSRDMGATWCMLLVFHHRWKFREMESFLLVSRNEDLVDSPEDPDSLFWKLDFLESERNMPGFLRAPSERTAMHVKNLATGSTIDGASTTGNVGRGGRRTAAGLDEFASVPNGMDVEALAATQSMTDCRIFNTTPKGRGKAAYHVSVNKNIRHVFMHWSLHPEKSDGLYVDDRGEPRSPWRDAEEVRCPVPFILQQELEMDDLAADRPFFDGLTIDRLIRLAKPPILQGVLEYDEISRNPKGWSEVFDGEFKLWISLVNGEPPQDRDYVVSADISTGKASDATSNSVLTVSDCSTKEKIGELTTNEKSPEELADVAIALCRWFRGLSDTGAHLIWEDNGPGGIFGRRIIANGYRRIFYRGNERDLKKRQTTMPGWWTTPTNKITLLGEYRRATASGEFKNPSKEALLEMYNYQYKNGSVMYVSGGTDIDPGSIGDNHGDRVIADALNWRMLQNLPKTLKEDATNVPVGCLAWRRQQRKAVQRKASRQYY